MHPHQIIMILALTGDITFTKLIASQSKSDNNTKTPGFVASSCFSPFIKWLRKNPSVSIPHISQTTI